MIPKENSHGKNAVNVMYRIVDTKILLNYFHLCQRPKKITNVTNFSNQGHKLPEFARDVFKVKTDFHKREIIY